MMSFLVGLLAAVSALALYGLYVNNRMIAELAGATERSVTQLTGRVDEHETRMQYISESLDTNWETLSTMQRTMDFVAFRNERRSKGSRTGATT